MNIDTGRGSPRKESPPIAASIAIAVAVMFVAFSVYKNIGNPPPGTAPSPLTNEEETLLQARLAEILESENELECATLSDGTYRLMCEQILTSSGENQLGGVPLEPSPPAEAMTDAQLQKLVEDSALLPRYDISVATTTL